MSIQFNKQRKQYFICYSVKVSEGKYKTIAIYNKNWTEKLGKKYMKSIEQMEIDKDKKKRGLYNYSSNEITMDILIDKYLESRKERISASTSYVMSDILKNIFTLNKTNLNELHISDVFNEEYFQAMRKYLIKKYKSSTINNTITKIRGIAQYTKKQGYISSELYDKLEEYMYPISNHEDVEEKDNFFTAEEYDKFISTFEKDDPYRFLFEFLYVSGVRIGEALALKWKDINLENNTVKINKSINLLKQVTKPKNSYSIRTISISTKCSEDMRHFRYDIEYGNEDEPVFFSFKQSKRVTIKRILDKHCEIANVKKITIHGFRHSCASRLFNAGVNISLISKHLGHSNVSTTLNTYAHWFNSDMATEINNVFNKI